MSRVYIAKPDVMVIISKSPRIPFPKSIWIYCSADLGNFVLRLSAVRLLSAVILFDSL